MESKTPKHNYTHPVVQDESGQWWLVKPRYRTRLRLVACDQCGQVYLRERPKARSRSNMCSNQCKAKHSNLGKATVMEKHPRWRGGRFTTATGYVMVMQHGHPNANKSGYVFEHRIVMERFLGRRLLRNETVHHINGVCDDNRPENLELWVKSQPSGQRPEDLVAYARTILALYGKYVRPASERIEPTNVR